MYGVLCEGARGAAGCAKGTSALMGAPGVCIGIYLVTASWLFMLAGIGHWLQSKVGKLEYLDYSNDVRLEPFEWEGWKEEWSPEEVYKLITLDGLACRPEDHQVRGDGRPEPAESVPPSTHAQETSAAHGRPWHAAKCNNGQC